MLEFHRIYWQSFSYTWGSEYARVLNHFLKQLCNEFKFKYPMETLKNKTEVFF